MLDVKQCLAECEEKMEMSVMHLEETLSHIRAGKANVHILDEIRVNSYGSMVPINNVASVTTPDARTIAILALCRKTTVKSSAWLFRP